MRYCISANNKRDNNAAYIIIPRFSKLSHPLVFLPRSHTYIRASEFESKTREICFLRAENRKLLVRVPGF